jgi:hypothetical protein
MNIPVTILKDDWLESVGSGSITKKVLGESNGSSYELVTLRNVTLTKGAIMFLLRGGTLVGLLDKSKITGYKNHGNTLLVFATAPDLTCLPVTLRGVALAFCDGSSGEDLRNSIFIKEYIKT